jgi:hypothetical protein
VERVAHPASTALHDAGDPLLNTAILHWNDHARPADPGMVAVSDLLPDPGRDGLLRASARLSVIATPFEWITGSPLVSYNLVALLTYPLSAIAMYALVWRLTRSAAGAFSAGLAYALAPYRVPQSPHLQMLATFWAPLALLGLHGYVETRRLRWLVLFGRRGPCRRIERLLPVLLLCLGRRVGGCGSCGASRLAGVVRVAVTVVIAAFALAPVLYGYLVVHTRKRIRPQS